MANQTWIFIKLNLLCFALCLLFALCEFLQTGLITEMGNISNFALVTRILKKKRDAQKSAVADLEKINKRSDQRNNKQ
jgi:hypothetical protein